MALSTLNWLKAQSGYSFDDDVFQAIAEDRGIEDMSIPHAELTQKNKELMQADIVFKANIFSPTSTASVSKSHSGFTHSIGSQTTTYSKDKINWALSIYKKYGDPKYDEISEGKSIRLIQIKDKL